jgi:N-acetylmuramoyl-L-alanine amidase
VYRVAIFNPRVNFGRQMPDFSGLSRFLPQRAARRLAALVLAGCTLSAACLSCPPAVLAAPTIAHDARLAGDKQRTRFIADLSKKVDVTVFSLDDPYRVIIDLPDVSFQMPAGLGKNPKGLVTGYRYGLFAPGKSRIVIDVGGPFLVDKSFVLDAREGQPARLVVDLVPTSRATFLAKQKQAKAGPVDKAAKENAAASPPTVDPIATASSKPVVVLDPGHGGVDPGTSAADGTMEKNVVLAFAKLLRKQLEATGKFTVLMTRDDDTFIPLQGRTAFARKNKASLFLSIHADSFPTEAARGATVFTLSDRASDAESQDTATKENLSDAVAGYEASDQPDDAVADILLDLAQRETQNRSIVFASSITSNFEGHIRLHSKAPKSASFVVLKSPDVPSVLLELGYLSDRDDEKLLLSNAWRVRTAAAVTRAIESYFDKRVATIPF